MCHCFSQQTPAALVEAKSTECCNATHTNRGTMERKEREKVFIKPKKTCLEGILSWLSSTERSLYNKSTSTHFEMLCIQLIFEQQEGSQKNM